MQVTKYAVLCCITAVIKKYKGTYSYASQEVLLGLLEKYHGIKISTRQLNYHLKDLRKEGFIKSRKRCGRRENGTVHLMTSATCLTIKGCLLLMNKGYTWAASHLSRLRKFYIPFFQSQKNHHKDGLPANNNAQPDTLKKRINEAHAKGVGLYHQLLQSAKIPTTA